VAKFRGDWPTELGDLVLKTEKETSPVKHKPVWNYRSRWPNNKKWRLEVEGHLNVGGKYLNGVVGAYVDGSGISSLRLV